MQQPLFVADCDWRPPNVSTLPSWANAKRVSIDTETYDPNIKKLGMGPWRDGRIVGVSFAIEDGPNHYLPFGHEGGDNLDKLHVINYLKDQAKVFKGILVGAYLQYDINYLWTIGVDFKPKFFRCVQVAEGLCDEHQNSYSLDNIAKRHGIAGKDDAVLQQAALEYGFDPKADMWRLPARFVGAYAERDVTCPNELLRRQERQIEREDLWEVYDLESRVLPVLAKMHRRGVRVDLDRLDKVAILAKEEQYKAVDEINARTGCKLGYDDLNKGEAVAKPLESVGIKVPKTEKKEQPSVTQPWLLTIKHPVAAAVIQARKFETVQSGFVNSIRRHVVGDRLHCTHNQLRGEDDEGNVSGARFGRMSASHPNLQQQPSPGRDPDEGIKMGALWRGIYVPEHGKEWCSLDYSQQEPRLIVHYSDIMGYPGAAEAIRKYKENPKMDFHQFMADLTGLKRKPAKNIFLGICYGKGGAALCRELGFPTQWIEIKNRGQNGNTIKKHDDPALLWCEVAGPEGQAIMDQFAVEAPFVKKLNKRAISEAKKNGFITTLSGRRCRFPLNDDGTFDWTHLAINRLIQGSAADQMKKAMVDLDDANIPLQLQVHDEVNFSEDNRDRMNEAKDIMENAVELRLPSRVDLEVGPSWGEIKKVVA